MCVPAYIYPILTEYNQKVQFINSITFPALNDISLTEVNWL